jgi:hypothetical protein
MIESDPTKQLESLLKTDDTDEKLYAMVREAKAISKAARLAKIVTQERIDAQASYESACQREQAAVAALSALILKVK